jgi:hypothetical protein
LAWITGAFYNRAMKLVRWCPESEVRIKKQAVILSGDRQTNCHPERRLARIVRQSQSKDLRLF